MAEFCKRMTKSVIEKIKKTLLTMKEITFANHAIGIQVNLKKVWYFRIIFNPQVVSDKY